MAQNYFPPKKSLQKIDSDDQSKPPEAHRQSAITSRLAKNTPSTDEPSPQHLIAWFLIWIQCKSKSGNITASGQH
jgi:hypothetical protein